MKRLFLALAAGFLALGLDLWGASAANYTMGALVDGENDFGGGKLAPSATPSSLPGITFTLAHAANVVIDVFFGTSGSGSGINSTGLTTFTFPGLAAQTASGSTSGSNGYEFSYSNLAAGDYFVSLAGVYFGAKALLGGSVTVASTPIPASLLMFITAIGGLGFAGYRRRSIQG